MQLVNNKKETVHLYKPIGKTPLESLHQFQSENDVYRESKLAYAGRLDPMAHGDLLVLVDDACKNRDEYQKFNKEYIFKFILGITTDTSDLFGVVQTVNIEKTQEFKESYILSELQLYNGTIIQQLPIFSSHRVKGKPLFWWANQNRLSEIEIPTKEVQIYSQEVIFTKHISIQKIKKKVNFLLKTISGDFRYNAIRDSWQTVFDKSSSTNIPYVCVKVQVSSGTYIRSIVQEIGENLGVGAVAVDIFRTRSFPQ